jgi:arylsulfatase A-like enzyme
LRAATLPALLLALLVAGCSRPESAEPAPHLLLISVDTLRRDALRAYSPGAVELPALDALAARSVVCERALSPAAWTLPAHASLLTGLLPHRHGAVHKKATLAAFVPTLAEALQRRGYETRAHVDGGFLASSYGLDRGFGRYDDGDDSSGAQRVEPLRRAAAELVRRRSARPLFLFAHTYAVHDYFHGEPAAAGATAAAASAGASDAGATSSGAPAAGSPPPASDEPPPLPRAARQRLSCLLGDRRCSAAEWAELRRLYAARLRHLDGELAALLTAAEAALADRPLWVVLVSDHGEGLDPASGPAHHGGSLHPAVLTVPLLIAPPGNEAVGAGALRVRSPVSLLDLAPTLLDLAGNRGDGAGGEAGDLGDPDGVSLLPLLRGGTGRVRLERRLAGRDLPAEEHYYWWRDGRRRSARDVLASPIAVALLREPWWYLRSPNHEEVLHLPPPGAPLDGVRAAGAADEAPLAALRRAARPLMDARAVPTAHRGEDPELEKRLEALGYGGGP